MGLLLAFAGVGAAMQLDRGEKKSLIRVGDVGPAAVDKAVKSAQAKLKGQKLKRLLKGGNRPALLRYLKQTFGVDPKRVVIQNGKRNYAGPKCPGKAWNCTRARQVVQYSLYDHDDDNGGNRFTCSSSYGGLPLFTNDPTQPTLACFVVQVRLVRGNNRAECIQQTNSSPDVTQHCDIEQFTPDGDNRATIRQGVHRTDNGPAEQEVSQQAFLAQTAIDGNNRADIDQDVRLIINGSSPQEQDAHQLADASMETQDGNNTANVDQNQDLDEHATGAVVQQLQNTDLDDRANCANEEPLAPNSCADIDMFTSDGNNRLDLDQENDLDMTVRGRGGDDDDDDDDDDDNGDDDDDNGDDFTLHNGDDDDDDDDDDNGNGGSGNVTGFEQQGSCVTGPEETTTNPPVTGCVEDDESDGGTEASINMFSFEDGSTISHMSGLVEEDMPRNQPGIEQLQFGDPWCCFGTFFLGDPARSNIDLEVDQTAGDDAYQDGQNGVGCVAAAPDGGDGTCSARLTVSNNEGTSVVEAEGQAIFGRQDCESGPTVTTPVDPDCDGETVVTVTTETIPPPTETFIGE